MNEQEKQTKRILLVDDDDGVRRDYARMLKRIGDVTSASDGTEAVNRLRTESFDVILSDLQMPRMGGVEFLRNVREHDLDVPVILMTGDPSLDTAVSAVEFGAFRYLTKPVDFDVLIETTQRAIRLHAMAKLKREALELTGGLQGKSLGDRASLETRFTIALKRLWIAYQPIVSWPTKKIFGYEALVRSDEASLGCPADIIDAAERLDRVHDLGRMIRRRVADAAERTPEASFFVNLHPLDLNDEELYSPKSRLAAVSSQVVLEVTERASLHEVKGVSLCSKKLRTMGYRIAVDDLGAGYAGLNTFALLEPDVVKLDMCLVRGIHESVQKRSVVRAMLHLCNQELGIRTVCEGVETLEEHNVLVAEGCDLLQGHLFAPPARTLTVPNWPS